MSQRTPQWLLYAIASGACAALNGVFAKLTTTELTSTWASTISHHLGQTEYNDAVEYAVRAAFLLLNLAFNGVMWGLFTRALTLGDSTVRVSVINTSANFMLTALLGAVVFSEELPGQWWLGASLLVAGSVIIGRRGEANTVPPNDSKVELNKAATSTQNIISEPKVGNSAYDLRKRGWVPSHPL